MKKEPAASKFFSLAGQGGLEVCGHGARQTLPLDLHHGRRGGHRRHHPAGAQPLRRQGPHRQGAVGHWARWHLFAEKGE